MTVPGIGEVFHVYLRTEEKAERVGFEPTRRFNTAYAISSRAPSANSDTSPATNKESIRWGRRESKLYPLFWESSSSRRCSAARAASRKA